MDLKSLFSVEGRSTRMAYWVSQIALSIPYFVLMSNPDAMDSALGIISLIAMLIMFIPVLFISIKRWHDLDKPGIYVLINLIPYVGSFITVIMQGFMGPVNTVDNENQYGTDPREN